MTRLIIFIGLLIIAEELTAQVAERTVPLPDSILQADPEWVDLDNDGLLDIMMLMKSQSGKNYIGIIKGDTVNALVFNDKSTSIISYGAYIVADYNRDNAMDVVISGEKNGFPVTAIYINKGKFEFEEVLTALPQFSKARFADLDNDALPELIVSGEDQGLFYTRILKQDGEYSWQLANDSLKMKCTAIEALDADGDGDLDLYLSGKIEPDSLLSGFLINEGNFYLKLKNTLAFTGNASIGDLNGDGFFDIVLMGQDNDGKWQTKQILHTAAAYSVEDLSIEVKNGKPFIADFNSDGVSDLQFHGTNASGDTINTIRYSNNESLLLNKHKLVSQRFGDREHDGDLDFLYLVKKDSLIIILKDNSTPQVNLGPGSPKNAVALPIFNRLFMYWDKPADDHTPEPSLTYDVFLNGIISYQAGEFDLLNEKRLTVTHGNNGTENFRLLRKITVSGIAYSIQAVDNAFHSGRPCIGQGGVQGGNACTATVDTEEVSACSKENVVLKSPPNALWFSFADGYLGKFDQFIFSSEKGDTVFYYNPMATDCGALKAWVIKINNDTIKVEQSEKYACENEQLQFHVEPGWDDIQWTSNLHGNLGSSDNLTYTVTSADSLIVTLTNSTGCKIIRKTAIKISKPELQLSGDHYKIMKGAEVQLQAEGAQRYVWTPSTALNKNDIPNPVASPASSIQYVVTGYDSLGCEDQSTVTVTVEETGFIPNLFSPNDDGKNDQLKIYGLASAQRFSFSIYNREGNLVYKTSDVSEAVQRGWDGTKNGTKQPAGVYFWKVKGEASGGEILLNGKDSGSIVLVR